MLILLISLWLLSYLDLHNYFNYFFLDENGCKVTTVPPVADTTIWEHPSLPHALGKLSSKIMKRRKNFFVTKNRLNVPKKIFSQNI